ncbi:MAG TPA: maleylpyruvate isomerase family mycothiol-dependent enzyme [Actinomycetes bacterium]|nr:maleylpyruvate isomerase family mycothiol-dependent enzyme [Actinomycetes bacterium]
MGEATATTPALPRSLGYTRWMVAAAEEYRRLDDLLRGLAPDQWLAPTDCAGWDVHDVVAHLAGAAVSTASLAELLRQAWRAHRVGGAGDLVDRMNQLQVRDRAGCSAQELVGDLERSGRRGVTARRRIPHVLRSIPLPFGPPLGTRPVGYLTGRVYTRDAWMHRVDLARATGADLVVTPDHDGAIVEDLVAEWAALHGEPYDLRLCGPAGGHWTSPPGAEEIRLDAIEFARMLSGRRPGEGLLARHVPF